MDQSLMPTLLYSLPGELLSQLDESIHSANDSCSFEKDLTVAARSFLPAKWADQLDE